MPPTKTEPKAKAKDARPGEAASVEAESERMVDKADSWEEADAAGSEDEFGTPEHKGRAN